MADWWNDLGATWDQAWQRLARGTADPKAPARHPTLATISAAGPEARTVVLRAATASAGTLEVHTDAQSHKADELRADPRAALHVWEPRANLQLRLRCRATLAPGDRATWDAMPEHGRLNYGSTPPPGTPIPAPDAYEKSPDLGVYTRILLEVTELDTVYLGRDSHRRALFRRADGWRGAWLAP
ncbi:MAG: pyridoxamine 5'-phosphate oxidase family protein [Shimia sp.]